MRHGSGNGLAVEALKVQQRRETFTTRQWTRRNPLELSSITCRCLWAKPVAMDTMDLSELNLRDEFLDFRGLLF